jgi:3-phosphoshikimate 1-carboxyvinyltransferase
VPDEIEIVPLESAPSALITSPGSKSITNRILLFAAMALGRSVISGALISDDTRFMACSLGRLGFRVSVDETDHELAVEGAGGKIPAESADLFVGGAGTAMRFLAAFVTLGCGRFRLDGNERMRQRPVGPLLDALKNLGVHASSVRNDGCPPIIIEREGDSFQGGTALIDAAVSSQFASALIIPAPLWQKGLILKVLGETAWPFIDMTIRLMERRGVRAWRDADTIMIPGGQAYQPGPFRVEADASSASYFAAAAALTGGRVVLAGIGRDSVQGDVGFLTVLEKMGAQVRWLNDGPEVSGSDCLKGVDVAMNGMPDMVPTLAAIAPFASSPTRIRKVAFIRHHESDRILALSTELRRLGARVEEHDDGLTIWPSSSLLRPAAIETYNDHRIAMAFSVAGLKLAGVRIKNPGCAAKTYPGFFEDLARLRRKR